MFSLVTHIKFSNTVFSYTYKLRVNLVCRLQCQWMQVKHKININESDITNCTVNLIMMLIIKYLKILQRIYYEKSQLDIESESESHWKMTFSH